MKSYRMRTVRVQMLVAVVANVFMLRLARADLQTQHGFLQRPADDKLSAMCVRSNVLLPVLSPHCAYIYPPCEHAIYTVRRSGRLHPACVAAMGSWRRSQRTTHQGRMAIGQD